MLRCLLCATLGSWGLPYSRYDVPGYGGISKGGVFGGLSRARQDSYCSLSLLLAGMRDMGGIALPPPVGLAPIRTNRGGRLTGHSWHEHARGDGQVRAFVNGATLAKGPAHVPGFVRTKAGDPELGVGGWFHRRRSHPSHTTRGHPSCHQLRWRLASAVENWLTELPRGTSARQRLDALLIDGGASPWVPRAPVPSTQNLVQRENKENPWGLCASYVAPKRGFPKLWVAADMPQVESGSVRSTEQEQPFIPRSQGA